MCFQLYIQALGKHLYQVFVLKPEELFLELAFVCASVMIMKAGHGGSFVVNLKVLLAVNVSVGTENTQ